MSEFLLDWVLMDEQTDCGGITVEGCSANVASMTGKKQLKLDAGKEEQVLEQCLVPILGSKGDTDKIYLENYEYKYQ